MNKNVLKGMGILCASALFVACSHDVSVDEGSVVENVKDQYKAAFIKKYGEVDPNQSWDFTGYAAKAKTRAAGSQVGMNWELKGYANNAKYGMTVANMKKIIEADIVEIKEKVASVNAVKFDYTYSKGYLYPVVSHGTYAQDGTNYDSYELGAEYTIGSKTTATMSVIPSTVTACQSFKKDFWFTYGGYGSSKTTDIRNATFNNWRNINTMDLINADNARWFVGAKASGESDFTRRTVEYCKIFTVASGRQYICFSCNGNDDYSDLICLMQEFSWTKKEEPRAWGKRYLVEDMGRIGDFDFNDIVFDVVQLADGSQKCYVRALGGTINVTIKVGSTTWQKENGKVIDENGEEVDAVVTKMYNTAPPTEEWILAEFPVSGWDPEDNNVTVTVYTNGQNGTFYPMTVTFPEKGDYPMMVAVNVTKMWMSEQKSIENMPNDFLNDNDYTYSE
jgi:hypothetical protein